MAATHLIAVPSSNPPAANAPEEAHETGIHRIRMLQQQAKQLAREEVLVLIEDLTAIVARTAEIGDSGDAYPAGVREMATRITDELGMHAKVLRSMLDRSTHG